MRPQREDDGSGHAHDGDPHQDFRFIFLYIFLTIIFSFILKKKNLVKLLLEIHIYSIVTSLSLVSANHNSFLVNYKTTMHIIFYIKNKKNC